MPTTDTTPVDLNPPVPRPVSELGRLNNKVAELQAANAALKRENATLRQELNRRRREAGEELPEGE